MIERISGQTSVNLDKPEGSLGSSTRRSINRILEPGVKDYYASGGRIWWDPRQEVLAWAAAQDELVRREPGFKPYKILGGTVKDIVDSYTGKPTGKK
jgi:hypothetical protein